MSHDRYFINKTASRILDLNRRTLTDYLGNYDYYLEKRDEQLALIDAAESRTGAGVSRDTQSIRDANSKGSSANSSSTADSKQDWLARKEQQAAQRKKENKLKKCEEQIDRLESRNGENDLLMTSPDICTDVAKLQELTKEREANDKELADLYEKWELLSE